MIQKLYTICDLLFNIVDGMNSSWCLCCYMPATHYRGVTIVGSHGAHSLIDSWVSMSGESSGLTACRDLMEL